MRLEDVTAKIRPRGRWESIDMGCALARRSYGTIMLAWLLTVWPLWIGGIYLFGSFMSPGWHLLSSVLWCWLTMQTAAKIPLFVMSRKLFGEDVTVFMVFKEWWSKMIYKDFWARLKSRFSAARGLSLPVAELEGLKGFAYRSRVSLLSRNGGDGAVQATLVCLLMQLVMIATCYFFVGLVYGLYGENDVMEKLTVDLHHYGDEYARWWLLFLFYLFGVTVIEPFYIGSGFAMYVNSRTVTEGWDIELIFKRLSERLKTMYTNSAPSEKKAKTSGLAGQSAKVEATQNTQTQVQSLAQAGVPLLTKAQSQVEAPTLSKTKIPPTLLALGAFIGLFAISSPQAQAADERVEKILQSEEFDLNRSTYEEFEPAAKTKKSSSGGGSGSSSWSSGPSKSAAGDTSALFTGIFKMLIWSAAILAVVAIIWVIYKNRNALKKEGLSTLDAEDPKVKSVMGMDVTPESLPKEIQEEAREAWNRGEYQYAMSLLYRGAISWMVNQARVPIVESDTEEDCLRRVKSLRLESGQYFKGVTTNWVRLAYGKKLPTDAEVMRLCDHWPFHKNKVTVKVNEEGGQNAEAL